MASYEMPLDGLRVYPVSQQPTDSLNDFLFLTYYPWMSLITPSESLILVKFIFITCLGMGKNQGNVWHWQICDDCRDGDISSSVLIKYTIELSTLTRPRAYWMDFQGCRLDSCQHIEIS